MKNRAKFNSQFRKTFSNPSSIPSPQKRQELIDEYLTETPRKPTNMRNYYKNSPAIQYASSSNFYVPSKSSKYSFPFESIRLPVLNDDLTLSRIKWPKKNLPGNFALCKYKTQKRPTNNDKIRCLVNYYKSTHNLNDRIILTARNNKRSVPNFNVYRKDRYSFFPLDNEKLIEQYRSVLKGSIYRLQTFIQNNNIPKLAQFDNHNQ